MSGTDFVFNIAKGRIVYYATLPLANDALIMVLVKAAGLASDATLKDTADLGTILGASTECNATNYVRKTLTTVATAVDNTADVFNITCDNVVYTSLGGATNNLMGKALICYDNDTTAGTDSNIIPLAAYSYDGQTDGSTITLIMPAGGPLFAG